MEFPEEMLASTFQDLDLKSPVMLEILKEIKTTVETGSLSEAVANVQKALELSKTTNLNIAITGESGCGKSSFVNAMRGLQDDDEGAAKVDVIEATSHPTRYPYPNLSNVTMWDLPGIGTPNFRPDTYLQQVNFHQYDFFIIVASERFKCTHADLAREIKNMGKKFYFVRSKVDIDVKNEKRKKNFNEEKLLEKLRADYEQKLQDEGVSSPQVFLVSRWKFSKYDSCKLQETLADDLDGHKKNVFILALQNMSKPILKKKKEALEKQIWRQALLSCISCAVSLPFIKCDVHILERSVTEYYEAFGLGDNPLPLLARYTEKLVPELEGSEDSLEGVEGTKQTTDTVVVILFRITNFLKNVEKIAKEKKEVPLLTTEQMKMIRNALKAERCLSLIYFLQPIANGTIAFVVTYVMLQIFLEAIAEEAERVLTSPLAGDVKKKS